MKFFSNMAHANRHTAQADRVTSATQATHVTHVAHAARVTPAAQAAAPHTKHVARAVPAAQAPAPHTKHAKLLFVCALLCCVLAILSGCNAASTSNEQNKNEQDANTTATEAVSVSVASLKGPTSIGLVSFMEKAQAGETNNSFNFSVCGTADEILPLLIKGDIDIACIPANAASVVYNKTNGAVQVANINTLGVLYVVSANSEITSLESLSGKTVYMTGKGTTPEYVMNYVLSQAGLSDTVTLEYKSEATEVASVLAADPNAVAVLPEPYVSALTLKNEAIAPRISLTDEFNALSASSGAQLVTGVTVVRTAFAQEHPQAVQEFLNAQKASIETVNANPQAAAQMVVDAGIIDNAQAAARAIPRCNVVYLDGSEMKQALSGYLGVLYEQDASSVGGALPDNSFYML